MRLLLQRADLNRLSPHPVHDCLRSPVALAVMLAHGADPNAADDRGVRPLSIALSEGNGQLARELLEAGADSRGRHGITTRRSDFAYTALQLACAGNCDIATLRCLLSTGVLSVNELSADGRSALSHAVGMHSPLPAVALLLEAGADPNLGELPPMSYAQKHTMTEVALLLFLHGAHFVDNALSRFNLMHAARLKVEGFRLLALMRLAGVKLDTNLFGITMPAAWLPQWSADREGLIRSQTPLKTQKLP